MHTEQAIDFFERTAAAYPTVYPRMSSKASRQGATMASADIENSSATLASTCRGFRIWPLNRYIGKTKVTVISSSLGVPAAVFPDIREVNKFPMPRA